MNDLITVDASKARNNFFGILEKVYFENKSFLIKKAGVPFATITKPKEKSSGLMKLAGTWKDIDAKIMIDYIYEGRKDRGELKRKLPKIS